MRISDRLQDEIRSMAEDKGIGVNDYIRYLILRDLEDGTAVDEMNRAISRSIYSQ